MTTANRQPSRTLSDRERIILTQIAYAYDRLPVTENDGASLIHYKCFVQEVNTQFGLLLGTGLRIVWSETDPYANDPKPSAAMRREVDAGTLRVYSGPAYHPYLTHLENCRFRAIHDYYGHYKTGAGFGEWGELEAFRSHATMFSSVALPALAAETVGQNAWVNFFGDHASLERCKRPYAVQKASALSPAYWLPLLSPILVAGVAADPAAWLAVYARDDR